MRRNSPVAGFTLIELMVVVAIVGVLAAIAYPSYLAYVRQANRTDATKSLQLTAQSLQRCYSQNFTYLTGCNVVAGSTPSPNAYYTIKLVIPDAQDYTLTATPANPPQTGDTGCWTFTLVSTGVQTAANSGGTTNATITQTCWGSN
jgi:type IV pilus assembly protein PilE